MTILTSLKPTAMRALISSTAVDLDLLGTGKTYKMGFAPRVSVSRTFFSEEPDDWSYFPSATLSPEQVDEAHDL